MITEQFNQSPVIYEKLDWDKEDNYGSKYEKSHAIVFASMYWNV